MSLSWANSNQSTQALSTSWRSILILSSHLRLRLPNGLFPSGFPTRTLKILFTPRMKPEVTHRVGLPGHEDVSEELDVSIFRVTELRPNKIIIYLDVKFLQRSAY